ncbi:MAG: hypothetical protein A2942_00655 [Candidatus Lloydbacteria bacterium RIFCSPLOWO2_01_FULL_50_20]|uniref:Uncharacterized protein n=1 Tax=Candidatus Lloydbacteria bacterium RIFCSPLOWO2_01_FULL_50_20 TaxID=1798665 RepID=A0A1G2DJC2_9BACT|nr:MAG: hypothetical protein A3C13_02600 [Candidatus Lloydbacteria bacterium RIFCSPHIGHO2_02_FULL_50_11]OGZ13031.1 MAG: hypothetical protein A2942_00655 [Candidatus Lloydbacteria bacterium RIFCSPLOWO2_01_FULL_50_20]
MTEEKKNDIMKICELCKKEVKEGDGVHVLGGTAFECKQCAGDPKDHEHDKNKEGVCKFC